MTGEQDVDDVALVYLSDLKRPSYDNPPGGLALI